MRNLGKLSDIDGNDHELKRNCLGRLTSMLAFLFIIFCLTIWITVFLVFKDTSAVQAIPASILEQLTCAIFFGGLVLAVIVGSLGGNMLRRASWHTLQRRKK